MSRSLIFVRTAVQTDDTTISRHKESASSEAEQYRGSSRSGGMSLNSELRLVAGIGESVMGSLGASIDESNRWTIDYVFVDSECRNIGIGDALVLECLRELSERNATWVQSHALPGDRATKNLFERHGLVAQTIVVGRKV